MTDQPSSPVVIRIDGLNVYAYHGAVSEEQQLGQRFEFDVELWLDDCVACRSDLLDDAVDYAAVTAMVSEVATSFRFNLVEALAEAVCLELLAEFPIERVRLSVRKLAPPMPQPVTSVGVKLERSRANLPAERTAASSAQVRDGMPVGSQLL